MVVEIERVVMFYDTDAGGVMSNIAYLRFVEDARTELLTQLGHPLSDIAERREFPAVVRTEIDYCKPAVLGDTICIKASLKKTGRMQFWCAFELVRRGGEGDKGEGDEVLARCEQRLAFVRLPEGKVVPVPESIRRPM